MNNTGVFPCASCGYAYTKSVDTQRTRTNDEVRRRRVCLKCKEGFITYEVRAADRAFLSAARKWMEGGNLPS